MGVLAVHSDQKRPRVTLGLGHCHCNSIMPATTERARAAPTPRRGAVPATRAARDGAGGGPARAADPAAGLHRRGAPRRLVWGSGPDGVARRRSARRGRWHRRAGHGRRRRGGPPALLAAVAAAAGNAARPVGDKA